MDTGRRIDIAVNPEVEIDAALVASGLSFMLGLVVFLAITYRRRPYLAFVLPALAIYALFLILPVLVAENPLTSVVLGAGKMVSDFALLKRVKWENTLQY